MGWGEHHPCFHLKWVVLLRLSHFCTSSFRGRYHYRFSIKSHLTGSEWRDYGNSRTTENSFWLDAIIAEDQRPRMEHSSLYENSHWKRHCKLCLEWSFLKCLVPLSEAVWFVRFHCQEHLEPFVVVLTSKCHLLIPSGVFFALDFDGRWVWFCFFPENFPLLIIISVRCNCH